MCLVIYCPKGTNKLSARLEQSIRNGSESNGQGMGYALKKASNPGKIVIRKGFAKVEQLLETLVKDQPVEDDELLVHFRIRTQGKINTANTHPFAVSEDKAVLEVFDDEVSTSVLAHNGGFHDYSWPKSEYSDTYLFTRDFMAIPEILAYMKRDSTSWALTFDKTIGWNKFVVLHPEPELEASVVGKFEEDGGYYYSNQGYKSWGSSRFRDAGGQQSILLGETASQCALPFDIINRGLGDETEQAEEDIDLSTAYERMQAQRGNASSEPRIMSHVEDSQNLKFAKGLGTKFTDVISQVKLTDINFADFIFIVTKPNLIGVEVGVGYKIMHFVSQIPSVHVNTVKTGVGAHSLRVPVATFLEVTERVPVLAMSTAYHDFFKISRAVTPTKSMMKRIGKKLAAATYNNMPYIKMKEWGTFSRQGMRLWYDEHKDKYDGNRLMPPERDRSGTVIQIQSTAKRKQELVY